MLIKGRRLIIYLIILSALIFLNISARGCFSRSADKIVTGTSNYDTFTINAPSELNAIPVSPYQINLYWQDNSNNDDGFEIERRMEGVSLWTMLATMSPDVFSYADINLLPNINYIYRVRAFNSIGDRSSYSSEASSMTFQLLSLAIAAGDNHNIAMMTDKLITGWGLNNYFQLGLGDIIDRLIQTPVVLDTDWEKISAAGYHSIGLKSSTAGRTIWGWGNNAVGQLGFGFTEFDGDIPYIIGSDSDWSNVYCGGGDYESGPVGHNLAIKTNGTIWSWGWNWRVQLGLDITDIIVMTPTVIGSSSDWLTAAAGFCHSIAIKTNNTIWAWGSNDSGQLGFDVEPPVGGPAKGGGPIDQPVPAQIGNESDWSLASASGAFVKDVCGGHSVAIKTNGTLWSWGWNEYGQLGLFGTDFTRNTPTQIGAESNWASIDTGTFFTLAIK